MSHPFRYISIVLLLTLPLISQAALLMHLTLDNTLSDASGNGNNGSFPGGGSNPSYATAVLNEGLDFDGSNDYITVNTFDPGSSFTVALWVRADSTGGVIDTYIEHVANNQRNDFFLGYDNDIGEIFIELEDNNQYESGACGDPKFCTGIDLLPNRWYHLAAVVTPTTLTLYIDGEQAYSTTHSTTVNFTNGTWMIGADSDSSPSTTANTDYFDGRLDDIRVYDQALDQAGISELISLSGWWKLDQCSLASPGDVVDSSGNGNDGNPENGISLDSGKICNAGSFDGSDDYVGLPGFPNLTGSFTISAWIRPDVINKDQRIFADDENNSGGYAFSLGDGGDGRLRFFSRGISPVSLDSSTAISAGNWYYVVAVHDASSRTRQIFVNGSAVTSKASYSGAWSTDAGTASIGGETNSAGSEAVANWRFDGLIDEIKIYERALTAEEISDYYSIPDPVGRTCPGCGSGTANTLILSTDRTETLGGLTFTDGSLAEYDPDADSATLYFDESLFSASEDIDAVHVLANGHIILSTTGSATLGGLSFSDGDLVDYDPVNDSATLYFDESLFSANEDIDAVYIMSNGHILLSTTGSATLGGLSFSDGDLVEYDPVSDTATLYFS
ncbi:MAG TPA: LamG domain-containing protein, partial [Thiotrichales bacterium]|nr:LamG domain-containing protein [Thiotrichales bacterium]